jgi:phosphoserine phosphatase
LLAIFDVEGVLFDAEYLPILAEKINKQDEIWAITNLQRSSRRIAYNDWCKRDMSCTKGSRMEDNGSFWWIYNND